jgi:hypothetical protein
MGMTQVEKKETVAKTKKKLKGVHEMLEATEKGSHYTKKTKRGS